MPKRPLNDARRRALKTFMEARGLSAAGWAIKAGIPPSTLQSFLQGRSQSMRGSAEQLLASAVGVSVTQMYENQKTPSVPVVGRIGAGAIIYPITGDEGAMNYVEAPPTIDPKDVVAYEIEGFSMPPFKPGNHIFASKRDAGSPDDMLNEMCIVQVSDGPLLFKILRKGYEAGKFNLHSLNGEPPIEDQAIEWVARVVGATF